MKSAPLFLLAFFLFPPGAQGAEGFPGQHDLAQGIVCHQQLDFDCSQAALERALNRLSPGEDADYVAHLSEARKLLALIHVARDDLQRAEQEFRLLLLVHPGFELDPTGLPPKILYVFEQARQSLQPAETNGNTSPEPHGGTPPNPEPQGLPDPDPVPPSHGTLCLQAGGSLVGLFGTDSDALGPGGGPFVSLSAFHESGLGLALDLAWALHQGKDNPDLNAFSAVLEGRLRLPILNGENNMGRVDLMLGAGAGPLAMGSADRYDHWGLVLRSSVGLVWPASGAWGLSLTFSPSVLVRSELASFFLASQLAGEIRW